MFKKAKKGFTIVELVIVIAVIGILSGILIPTFSNLTQQAQNAALRSDLASSYTMYAGEAADDKNIVLVGQDKAFLVKTDAAAETGDLNAYTFVGGEWKVETTGITAVATSTGYHLVSNNIANSTFGNFVFYYYVA